MIILRQKEFGNKAKIALGTAVGIAAGHSITKKAIRKTAEKKYDPEKHAEKMKNEAKLLREYAKESDQNREAFEVKVNRMKEDFEPSAFLLTKDDTGEPLSSKELRRSAKQYDKTANEIKNNPEKYRRIEGEYKASFNPRNATGGIIGGVIGGVGTTALIKKLTKR